jgi:DNA repair ATPase RecN
MKYYKSIDTIPVWNYDKWLQTEDPRFLLKLPDYEELPEISDKIKTELHAAATEIHYQASEFELEKSKRNNIIFDLTKRLTNLECDYNLTNNILQLLELSGRDKQTEQLLQNAGYTLRDGKDFESELKRIYNQNQNKKSKINELRGELDAMTKNTGDPQSIESIQIALERHNNMSIDLHSTTLKKWIILKNDLMKEIERQQMKKQK